MALLARLVASAAAVIAVSCRPSEPSPPITGDPALRPSASSVGAPSSPAAGSAAGASGNAEGAWSSAVEGVRARLLLAAVRDGQSRPQLRIDLELENVRNDASPIEIPFSTCSGLVTLSVEDEAGKRWPDLHPGGNEMTLSPYWLELPPSSVLRLNAAPEAYEYVSPDRVLLRPFSFQGWNLPAPPGTKGQAAAYLGGVVKALTLDESGHKPWTGSIHLPRVAIPL